MRGKGKRTPQFVSALRITPAHAGKRTSLPIADGSGRDHPRPCGEKYFQPRPALRAVGSPPPMRGKVASPSACMAVLGITPAHAGKSLRIAIGQPLYQDHPRPCGEKSTTFAPGFALRGSPPPMWGKVNAISSPGRKPGITPAHAGKRSRTLLRVNAIRDHPRPCGEKGSDCTLGDGCTGSPPPMRGKETARKIGRRLYGITPAHAGKSLSIGTAQCQRRDHPRPCGEKVRRSTLRAVQLGSPPPMRGKVIPF